MRAHRSSSAARLVISILLPLLAAAAGNAGSFADGPYLMEQSGGWIARSIAGDEAAPQVVEKPMRTGDSFVVPAVGSMPAFNVRVRAPDGVAADTIELAGATPAFVIADTHGEYEILGELLRAQGVVDDRLQWAFGSGHVVVLGDVFDRGAHQIEILWLFYELEAQASRAGGGLHLLIGNHEAMVLGGDLRYLNPKYLRTQALLGTSYAQLVGTGTLLGQWLRTRPALMKIGDSLCMHGGISPELLQLGLDVRQINVRVRDVLHGSRLDEQRAREAQFLLGRLGPLWYRGYFPDSTDSPATSADVERMLSYFNVRQILVGHTRVPSVTLLYGRRVVAVQVYPHREERSGAAVMEALRIDGDRLRRAGIDGSLEPL